MASAAPEANSKTTKRARLRAKRSYRDCFVTNPRYSLVAAMRTAPMIKAANRMCVWTRTAITTFLPTMGTSRLPIGIRHLLLLAREVYDPAQSEEHVQEDHDHHQDRDDRREGPPEGAVDGSPVEPRHREQKDYKDRRHDDGPERYQGVAGEEHEHLLVEEEEPLGPRHVGDGGRVRGFGQRRRDDVREHGDHDEEQRRDVAVLQDLVWKERDALVVAVVDVLLGYLFFLFRGRFGTPDRSPNEVPPERPSAYFPVLSSGSLLRRVSQRVSQFPPTFPRGNRLSYAFRRRPEGPSRR